MKLEPDVVEAVDVPEEPKPDQNVQEGHVPVGYVCETCGNEFTTSLPADFAGKVRVECPTCGRVHNLKVEVEDED